MSLYVYLERLPAAFVATQEFVVQSIEWSGHLVAKFVHTGLTQTYTWQAIAPKVSSCWARVSPPLRSGYGVSLGFGLLACFIMNRTLKRANVTYHTFKGL